MPKRKDHHFGVSHRIGEKNYYASYTLDYNTVTVHYRGSTQSCKIDALIGQEDVLASKLLREILEAPVGTVFPKDD